ncbi:glutathione S-transferase family protein [Sphingomonas sp. UV9]|uniref:glutathione S-transferase family protein n=1 Tax=Sphingomonas sp. UV9 TaxID=1851410 RepID=UPI000FFBFD53|nr:glutathione S-transferase family protein [Sphingomonas sp. UV9]RXD04809.1 glutathione S-transferase family protein [Sphingomonas sp. UV9]
MMTLYYSPYACSMASHVALEEAGATFEAKNVNIFRGEQFKPKYQAINPRAKVPALRFQDGRVLLETTAILGWVGNEHLDGVLLGVEPIERARTIAACAWLSGTVHATFKHFIHPEHLTSDAAAHAAIKAQAKETYWAHLLEMDAILADRPWLMGESFTLADPYALVFFPWGRELGLPIADLTNLTALKDRLIMRPAARRALEREKSVLLKI